MARSMHSPPSMTSYASSRAFFSYQSSLVATALAAALSAPGCTGVSDDATQSENAVRRESQVLTLNDGEVFDVRADSFKVFDKNQQKVFIYSNRGALLATKIMVGLPNEAYGNIAPLRVLGNKWILGQYLLDDDFKVERTLFSSPNHTPIKCADGETLWAPNVKGVDDFVRRGTSYVALTHGGLTFFDANFNCQKRVYTKAWKAGGNSDWRMSSNSPSQTSDPNGSLYLKDDYVHYFYNAQGVIQTRLRMTPKGFVQYNPNKNKGLTSTPRARFGLPRATSS
jgi:hypothetical protein